MATKMPSVYAYKYGNTSETLIYQEKKSTKKYYICSIFPSPLLNFILGSVSYRCTHTHVCICIHVLSFLLQCIPSSCMTIFDTSGRSFVNFSGSHSVIVDKNSGNFFNIHRHGNANKKGKRTNAINMYSTLNEYI